MKKKVKSNKKKNIKIQNKDRNNNIKTIKNRFIEWIIYMIGYAIILITVSVLFKSFEINNTYYGIYALIAAIIIYLLNQTIKPVLTYLTLPITGLTLGFFYPIINVIILYITSFILGKQNFRLTGFVTPFFIAIIISILNILMEKLVLKPITKGRRKNG